MAKFVKGLIFDFNMEHIMLEKGPRLTVPGRMIGDEDPRFGLKRYIAAVFKMGEEVQPFWFHMRSEIFSADVAVHVFFCKVTPDELFQMEKNAGPQYSRYPVNLSHNFPERLAYLIPMARFLDKIPPAEWPRP